MALCHPVAQQLLVGNQLSEAEFDVGGDAPAQDMPLCLSKSPYRERTLDGRDCAEKGERQRDAAPENIRTSTLCRVCHLLFMKLLGRSHSVFNAASVIASICFTGPNGAWSKTMHRRSVNPIA